MFGITEYILAGVTSVALAAGGFGYVQMQQANLSKLEIQSLRGQLQTCGFRLQNIINDVERDNAIDNLTPDQLTDVPAHWLLAAPSTSGSD